MKESLVPQPVAPPTLVHLPIVSSPMVCTPAPAIRELNPSIPPYVPPFKSIPFPFKPVYHLPKPAFVPIVPPSTNIPTSPKLTLPPPVLPKFAHVQVTPKTIYSRPEYV